MDALDLDSQRAQSWRIIASCMLRLKWLAAATRFELAMRRHDRALKYGYNPDQPRVPRGQAEGGQWTLVAGPGGGSRTRVGGNFPGTTFGQRHRLESAIERTQAALGQIRQYDPNWRPTTASVTMPGSIEGAIRDSEARATEAEARLEQLRSGIGGNFGPPLDTTTPSSPASSRTFDGQGWINAYRAVNNSADLFGRPTWSLDSDTVAVTEFDGKLDRKSVV